MVELGLRCLSNLDFRDHSVSPTYVASHSSHLILYTGPTTFSLSTGSLRVITLEIEILVRVRVYVYSCLKCRPTIFIYYGQHVQKRQSSFHPKLFVSDVFYIVIIKLNVLFGLLDQDR